MDSRNPFKARSWTWILLFVAIAIVAGIILVRQMQGVY